jgi:probable HAF family extracellular repeat protein
MSRISFGLWAAMVLILAPLAGAQSYTVTDLGVLPGSTHCLPQKINDGGAVVGSCVVANQNQAFLWTPTNGMQALGTLPGDTRSVAYGSIARTRLSESLFRPLVRRVVGLKSLPIRMRSREPIMDFFPIEFETGREWTA